MEPDKYKEVFKKVKIIMNDDVTKVEKQAEEFCKSHTILEIKQYVSNIMFIFYLE